MSDRYTPIEITCDLNQLEVFAGNFARQLKLGDCVGLIGSMGSGKTTFVSLVAEALGVTSDNCVQSPTFSIVNQYQTSLAQPLIHADLYRLNSDAEYQELELFESFENKISFIEWADKFKSLRKYFNILIDFEVISQEKRKLTLQSDRIWHF